MHERDSILLQLHPRTENLPDHTIAICDLDVDLAFALCDQGHVFQADLLMSLVCLAFVREAHLAAPYISSAHHIQESLAAPVLLPQTAYARVLLFSCGHVHRAAVLINEALHQLRYRGIPSPAVDGILESLGGPHLPKVDTRLPPFLGAVAHPALLHKRCPTSVYDRTVHTVLEDGYLRLPRCSGEPPQKAGERDAGRGLQGETGSAEPGWPDRRGASPPREATTAPPAASLQGPRRTSKRGRCSTSSGWRRSPRSTSSFP